MKKSSKKKLAKRGVAIAGRAPAMGGTQVHTDKRKPHRSAQKQSLKLHIQHETARNRGPFSFLWPLRTLGDLGGETQEMNGASKRGEA